jgi:hypothetical protein
MQTKCPSGREAAITQARRSVKRAPAATPAVKTTRNGAQSTTLISEPSLFGWRDADLLHHHATSSERGKKPTTA